ncbi:hypothetical protein FRB97_004928, partial [Tulasnella sp. 331]
MASKTSTRHAPTSGRSARSTVHLEAPVIAISSDENKIAIEVEDVKPEENIPSVVSSPSTSRSTAKVVCLDKRSEPPAPQGFLIHSPLTHHSVAS